MCRSGFIFRYRVRNWRQYNRALVRRGSITFWVDEQAVQSWCRERVPGARGRSQLYTDTAIECALVVKTVFHLSLRATQGFLESVVRLMDIDLPVPDYTTICKRQSGLQVRLGATPKGQPRHVVIDTTGLKVFGAGEWYARKHGMGRGRRRTWRITTSVWGASCSAHFAARSAVPNRVHRYSRATESLDRNFKKGQGQGIDQRNCATV